MICVLEMGFESISNIMLAYRVAHILETRP